MRTSGFDTTPPDAGQDAVWLASELSALLRREFEAVPDPQGIVAWGGGDEIVIFPVEDGRRGTVPVAYVEVFDGKSFALRRADGQDTVDPNNAFGALVAAVAEILDDDDRGRR